MVSQKPASRKLLNGILAWSILGALLFSGCSTLKVFKRPDYSKIGQKRVALISISADPVARKIVEASLRNLLKKHPRFRLVSPPGTPENPEGSFEKLSPSEVAKRGLTFGADYSLEITVSQFEAGFHEKEDKDASHAKEVLKGQVALEFEFIHCKSGSSTETMTTLAQKELHPKPAPLHSWESGRDNEENFPHRLQFLEDLTNEAVQKLLAPT